MQRRYGKRGRKLMGMLAVLLAMGLVAAVAFPMSARAESFDEKEKCDITINLPKEDVVEGDKLDLVIDVYKVASAEPVKGYDTFALEATKDFASLQKDLDDLVDPKGKVTEDEFAQSAIKLVQKNKIAVTTSGELGKKIEGLASGLYLVLAHGKGLADPFDTVQDTVVTVADSTKYKYSFKPLLVTLPTKDGALKNGVLDADKTVLTSDDGDWVYSFTAELKPSMEPNRTYFTITKDLDSYELRQTTVFVFKVNYKEIDGTTVSIVKQMVFSSAGIQTLRFDNIPVGTDVIVTELYSGANYDPVPHTGQTLNADGTVTDTSLKNIQIPPVESVVNNVTFENDYDNTDKGGGSLENSFKLVIEKDQSGEETGRRWDLTRTYSQVQPEAK